jgi:hypothetical protein
LLLAREGDHYVRKGLIELGDGLEKLKKTEEEKIIIGEIDYKQEKNIPQIEIRK